MTSAAQQSANRANAQHSTGPKTAEGRRRIRLNAYRHGLTGQIRCLTAAEQQAFDHHCKGICEALGPVGALELALAQTVAENRWRLKRVRAIETMIFSHGPGGESAEMRTLAVDDPISLARSWFAKGDNFQLLALYEQRINRTIERKMAELRALRAQRQAVRRQAIDAARVRPVTCEN